MGAGGLVAVETGPSWSSGGISMRNRLSFTFTNLAAAVTCHFQNTPQNDDTLLINNLGDQTLGTLRSI